MIKMTKSTRAADDGFTVRDFKEGTEHALDATPRERELADDLVAAGFAKRINAPAKAHFGPQVMRLPLIEEYTKAGHPVDKYQAFIKDETETAVKKGLVVEVRDMNADELAADEKPVKPKK